MAGPDLRLIRDLGPRETTDLWAAHRAALATLPRAGALQPALVLKLRRPHAEALLARLKGTTALSMVPGDGGVVVRAWAGTRDCGPITALRNFEGSVQVVAVSMGGARRPHWWLHEVLDAFDVSVRMAQGTGNVAVGFPEASATLLRYVAPLKPHKMPVSMAAEVIRMASTVWSGVVQADHEGRPEVLEHARAQVCARGAPSALVDMLVDRKRRYFAKDPRILAVAGVEQRDGTMQVVVQASLPE